MAQEDFSSFKGLREANVQFNQEIQEKNLKNSSSRFAAIKLKKAEVANGLFTQKALGQVQAGSDDLVPKSEDRLSLSVNSFVKDEMKISLEDTLQYAIDSNLEVQISESRKKIADLDFQIVKGNYIPKIGFNSFFENEITPIANLIDGGNNGSVDSKSWQLNSFLKGELPTGANYIFEFKNQKYRTNNVFQFVSPEYSSTFNFEIKQPLLRNLLIDETRKELKVKNLDRYITNYEFQQKLAEVLQKTESAYWDLLFRRKEVEINQKLIHLASEQIKRIERFVEVGKAPKVEIVSANAVKQKRIEDLAISEEKLFRKENDLKLLISPNQFSELWEKSLIPSNRLKQLTDSYLSLEDAILEALNKRPELKQILEEQKINRINRTFIVNDGLPQFDLGVQYSMTGLAGNPVNINNSLTAGQTINPRFIGNYGDNLDIALSNDFRMVRAGVTVSWPVAPYVVRKKVAKNRLERKILSDEINKLIQEIKLEVVNAFNSIKVDEQRINTGLSAVQDARIQLKAEEKRYSVGMSTTFLVLTRQSELADAELRLASAIADYNRHLAEYKYASGNNISKIKL